MHEMRRANMAKPGPPESACLADPDGVQFPLDIATPVFEKAAQLGEVRSDIELLPDEALQQVGMIRHVIDDLCGRQSIIAQRLLVVVHLRALVRFALSGQTSMADRLLLFKKNDIQQIISSLPPRLLPGWAGASLEAIAQGVR